MRFTSNHPVNRARAKCSRIGRRRNGGGGNSSSDLDIGASVIRKRMRSRAIKVLPSETDTIIAHPQRKREPTEESACAVLFVIDCSRGLQRTKSWPRPYGARIGLIIAHEHALQHAHTHTRAHAQSILFKLAHMHTHAPTRTLNNINSISALRRFGPRRRHATTAVLLRDPQNACFLDCARR